MEGSPFRIEHDEEGTARLPELPAACPRCGADLTKDGSVAAYVVAVADSHVSRGTLRVDGFGDGIGLRAAWCIACDKDLYEGRDRRPRKGN